MQNTTKKTTTKKSSSIPKKSVAKSDVQRTKTVKTKSVPKNYIEKTAKSKKATAKSVTKNTTVKKNVRAKQPEIIEYYDLPYRYNQTIVRILAQTPNTLFVYWDISNSDREKYLSEFGEDFFSSTYPVLIVHNKTRNYSFEIEINDFANSWYFNIKDAKCDYEIELGRRTRNQNINLPNNYKYITSSNVVEIPNNHILFEKKQNTLFFRNAKNNKRFSKDVSEFEFMSYVGKIYNIFDLYKKIYKNEEMQESLKNPSSNFNKGAF